jgi:hypothetical protein
MQPSAALLAAGLLAPLLPTSGTAARPATSAPLGVPHAYDLSADYLSSDNVSSGSSSDLNSDEDPLGYAICKPSRPCRIAMEMTGCWQGMLTNSSALSSKVQNVEAAEAAGFEVHLYGVLEDCWIPWEFNETERDAMAATLRETFGERVKMIVPNATILDDVGTLKPEVAAAHPGFPYNRDLDKLAEITGSVPPVQRVAELKQNDPTKLLSMWYKWHVARKLRLHSKITYQAVWRTRPDSILSLYPWPDIKRLLTQNAFATPDVAWSFSSHTDMDNVFGIDAAEVADTLFTRLPWLYDLGVLVQGESMLRANLQLLGMRCRLVTNMTIQLPDRGLFFMTPGQPSGMSMPEHCPQLTGPWTRSQGADTSTWPYPTPPGQK